MCVSFIWKTYDNTINAVQLLSLCSAIKMLQNVFDGA